MAATANREELMARVEYLADELEWGASGVIDSLATCYGGRMTREYRRDYRDMSRELEAPFLAAASAALTT